MTVDEVIDTLQRMKMAGGAPDVGQCTVVVRCPVADHNCWLHDDNIRLEPAEGKPEISVVIIEGGFGA